MSKQATLFSAWGGSNPANQGVRLQNHPPNNSFNDAQFGDEDLQLTEKDLEDLYSIDDDVPTHSGNLQTGGSFHVGPSRSFLNSSIIEEGIPGFDNEAGQMWIYPTNYPLRDYQYNIVHKSLFTNTIVCLPTGLGKTFIAAVVMYNYYRWYPNGKIVFLAPTKPLVTQQIEACHNVMGIPQDHSAEMTGALSPKVRVSMWQNKRVFFLTPQVMQNDLIKATCPAQDVCCVVFDEAHKALGNHAYCQVVKELSKSRVRFRVLALSATPGNDLKAVQQVVTNLQIGHIELRSEESVDIQRYVNERKVEKIVVPLDGEILDVKGTFVRILSGVLSRLTRYGVLYHCSPDRLSKYQLLQARDQFRTAGAPSGVMPGAVEGDFASAISLFHAYELLQQHGMRSFYQFLTNTFTSGTSKARAEILNSPQFGSIMKQLKGRMVSSKSPVQVTDGPSLCFPRTGVCPKPGPSKERPSFFYSHPKLRRLEDVVVDHFKHFQSSDGAPNTRVMIFSQYRDSVQEIADMLNRHSPLVLVMSFVGHSTGKSNSKGLSQKEQTEIVHQFREGGYNTLVATCVGEEGLDIGDVDLIVCFDAPKSPIRLVQRMGRTGRKRKGRIVMIVAEGKEENVYNKSQSNKKSIHRAICNGCKTLTFYQQCHRMVPKHIHPQVHKMYMTVGDYVGSKRESKEGKKVKATNQGKVKVGAGGRKVKKGAYLNDQELNCWSEGLSLSDREFNAAKKSVQRCFSQTPFLCLPALNTSPTNTHTDTSILSRSTNTSLNASSAKINTMFSLTLDKWVNHQLARIPPKIVGPSSSSEQLMSTLEFMDMIRTGEDIGSSYDLEMKTFLNPNDSKCAEGDRGVTGSKECDTKRDESSAKSLPDEDSLVTVSKPRAAHGKRRHRIEDSVSDDDFLPVTKKTISKSKSDSSISTSSLHSDTSVNRSSTLSIEQDRLNPLITRNDSIFIPHTNKSSNISKTKHRQSKSPTSLEQHLSSEDDQTSNSPVNQDDDHSIFLTQSQHIIPRAPSEDGLDWLNDLEPSQISTPQLASTTGSLIKDPELSPVANASNSKKNHSYSFRSFSRENDFDYATPNLPLSSKHQCKLRPSKCSTPATEFVVQVIPKSVNRETAKEQLKSFDMFADLSARALFDDFSTSAIIEDGEVKPPLQGLPREVIEKSPKHAKKDSVVIVLSDSDNSENGAVVDMIEESDFEQVDSDVSCGEHCAPHISPNVASRQQLDSPEDSFLNVQRKCRKRSHKSRNAFLQSPTTPSDLKPCNKLSPGSKENDPSVHIVKNLNVTPKSNLSHSHCKKKLKVTFESSDDEFDMPLSKRIAQQKPTKTRTLNVKQIDTFSVPKSHNERASEFVDEEADVSDNAPHGTESDQECDDYDCDDSFINDNSMLTQFSPSQRAARSSRKVLKATANSDNLYLRSLMSPEDHLFAGKRRGCGSKYRMVFSQRHELLNHYINKAGFKVDQSRRRKQKNRFGDNDLFEADSSGSEAEEVHMHYGEEDVCSSQSVEEESSGGPDQDSVNDSSSTTSERYISELQPHAKRKRKAVFLSDSEADTTCAGSHEDDEQCRTSSNEKKLKLTHSIPGSSAAACNETYPPPGDVIISPSLLASIKVRPTPPCFSLGMDDWIEDSDWWYC